MQLKIYDSIKKCKIDFIPINSQCITMYVCGPTVYSTPHIGNARSAVVYDVIFRVLQSIFPTVKYVRNITDVDDKIIEAAKKEQKNISEITQKYTKIFHDNMDYIHCLPPTIEPKATEHIDNMIEIIKILINNNSAYEANGHVYFNIKKYSEYGKLSKKIIDDLEDGARINVVKDKRNPGDFVLWKPKNKEDPDSSTWHSPWGIGRPGWHIECSAMINKHLGRDFDIHGGGADLKFPHHDNEIAQSCCAFEESGFAKYWIHNGFVTVDDEKMSKSLNNIVTIQNMIKQNIQGEVARYALISTHYRKPLNWSNDVLTNAKKSLDKIYNCLKLNESNIIPTIEHTSPSLLDDFNTPLALTEINQLLQEIKTESNIKNKNRLIGEMVATCKILGLLNHSPASWLDTPNIDQDIIYLIEQRSEAKKNKDFEKADEIRITLSKRGIKLKDLPDGSTKVQRN